MIHAEHSSKCIHVSHFWVWLEKLFKSWVHYDSALLSMHVGCIMTLLTLNAGRVHYDTALLSMHAAWQFVNYHTDTKFMTHFFQYARKLCSNLQTSLPYGRVHNECHGLIIASVAGHHVLVSKVVPPSDDTKWGPRVCRNTAIFEDDYCLNPYNFSRVVTYSHC